MCYNCIKSNLRRESINKKQRDELLEMKEYIGVAEILSVVRDKTKEGEFVVNKTEMSSEEAEEYLKIKNACNLNKIRKGVTALAVIGALLLILLAILFFALMF